jgi:hypothetical protein
VVVLLIVGTLMIQSFTVQGDVQTSNNATTVSQAAVASIQNGVRTSTVLTWSSSSSGELLIARTNNSVGAVSCKYQAWYYSTAGTLYTKRSTALPTAPTTAAQFATWNKLATGVSRSGSTLAFTTSSTQVDVRFNIAVEGGNSLPIKTTIVSRGTTLESHQCS